MVPDGRAGTLTLTLTLALALALTLTLTFIWLVMDVQARRTLAILTPLPWLHSS